MRPRPFTAITPLLFTLLLASTIGPSLAQDDPHHPADGAAVLSSQNGQPVTPPAIEFEAPDPDGTQASAQAAACPDAVSMMNPMMGSSEDNTPTAMSMMQMMQSMAGMQAQMMQGMTTMQAQMMQSMQMMMGMQLEMMQAMHSTQREMMRIQMSLGDQRRAMEQMP